MMDHVKAPEHRNGMEHNVLEVDGKVKDQYAEDNIQPIRQIDEIEDPPASLLEQKSKTDQGGWEYQSNSNRINENETEIRAPARYLRSD
jgi:hypothetical protein